MFQRLSDSKLPIAKECPAAFAMEAHALPSGPWAARGTIIHNFIDTAFRESRDAALAALPSENAEDEKTAVLCQRIPLHEIVAHFGGEPLTEVQFAYDPVEDRCIEVQDRQHVPDGWLGGKIDGHRVVGHEPETVKGGDWKSGFAHVPAPLQNLQLRSYALKLSRRYDVARVEFAVVDIDEEGFPFVRNAVFEEMELDAARSEIRGIMEAVATERFVVESRASGTLLAPVQPARLVVGAHCRYCEALPSCPAFVGETQALVAVHDRTLEMSPAQLGEVWAKSQAVQIAVDRVQSAIRFQVEERGLAVPLPDGKELRVSLGTSRTLSGKITQEVMQESGLGLAFLSASKVTFTGIERACGDRSSEVLAEIERRGGVSTSTHTKVLALKPKAAPR